MRFALILVATVRLAHADSPSTIASATTELAPTHTLAIAINEPFGWNHANALALSAYGAIDAHQVIRLNVATWSHAYTEDADAGLGFLLSGGDDEGGVGGDGRYTDVGAAWMYFPRRAYDGPSLELGAVLRMRDTLDYRDDLSADADTYTTTTIGGRALVGWSWLGWNRVFVSFQTGLTVGRESGSHLTHLEDQMDTTMPIHQVAVSTEAFLRFGVLLNP